MSHSILDARRNDDVKARNISTQSYSVYLKGLETKSSRAREGGGGGGESEEKI